ncbi:MAG: hypothetical protein HYV39_01025 [Candidatus Levybacteria bacterium]|nr:hypothetical protein [Candidatus Levybacteria bacterium]
MRKVSIIVLSLVFLTSFGGVASAHHKERVLGAQTSIVPQIPPTVEGPGLLLPDSPLFFLDRLKQNVRLVFAFTPEAKAKVRADIAGERMAELRFMLAKDNKPGIDTALQGVSENLRKAAEAINEAQLSGRSVFSIAKSINEDIRRKQEAFDVLEATENREISFKAKAAQAGLLQAKVRVEDALPEDELENEIEDDLHRLIEDEVEDASRSARRIAKQLEELGKQASEAAEKTLGRREEALRRAIEQKNEALRQAEERMLESEQKKRDRLLKVQEKAAEQARIAVEEAQKAAERFREAQKAASEIKTTP